MRSLGPVDATMIVMGSMIGSGIFITSAESSRLSGAPGWLLLAWAIAGLLTITGALCCSELATMMPRAGGVYIFLREAYGKSVGFLYGWTLFLVIQTGTIAAVAIAFAKFLGVFVAAVSPDNYLVAPISFGSYAISLSTEQLVAIGLIALLTWTNTRGLEVRKDCPKHVHVCKDSRARRGSCDRSVVRLECQLCCAAICLVGLMGKRLEPAGRPSPALQLSAGSPSCCYLENRWSVRSLRRPPGQMSHSLAVKYAIREKIWCVRS